MPELPEVEATRRGLEPHLRDRRLLGAVVREPRLRWPVPGDLAERVAGQRVLAVDRRARYLLLRTPAGAVIVHLGMTGSLRLAGAGETPARHDHLDLVLDSGRLLRFTDPRRFGAVLWADGDPADHELLRGLGPEPLGDGFDGDRLYRLSRGRRGAVKPFLMDNAVVVGVGNIYASEALYLAGIDPRRPAGRISRERYARLAARV
ncbi:MAG: bifunctional DNA-formamidopyrimidine glycosylase/DNA-(apurinic or apyrimidinic site) lyase, partial [Deferrisomatales bacterium]